MNPCLRTPPDTSSAFGRTQSDYEEIAREQRSRQSAILKQGEIAACIVIAYIVALVSIALLVP